LLTGESTSGMPLRKSLLLFQSTPVIANGRIAGRIALAAGRSWFQSTPVIANGRIVLKPPPIRHKHRMFQSTPVIANGRILRWSGHIAAYNEFQSTPVIANGRIEQRSACDLARCSVSIHARYC